VRAYLTLGCVLLTVFASGCAPKRPPQRAAVLHALIKSFALPQTQALCLTQTQVESRADALAQAPSEAAVQKLRDAWRQALLGWERVQALSMGPIVDSRALLRALYWPTRVASLKARVHDKPNITASEVAELGIDVRGVFALEWWLFGEAQIQLSAAGPEGESARTWVSALAHDATQQACGALAALGDGNTFANNLTANETLSISRITQQIVSNVETLASDHLASLTGPANAAGPQLSKAPARSPVLRGGPSGTSHLLVQAQLAATERLYAGAQGAQGTSTDDSATLSALVDAVAPAIDAQLRAHFKAALQNVDALDAPLEHIAQRDTTRVKRAYDALKVLERALKTQLPSALGATLTFDSTDGD